MGHIERVEDDTTLQHLWERHAHELVRFATLLAGPHDSLDVVSIAFARLAGRDLSEIANTRAYLYRTVTNVASDQRRSDRRRRARDLIAAVPEAAPDARDDLDLHRAVARLDVRERAIVYFTYWHDLTAEQIGELLDIHAGTVRRSLASARLRLRRDLA